MSIIKGTKHLKTILDEVHVGLAREGAQTLNLKT